MSDVPTGIARLLGRAAHPALPVASALTVGRAQDPGPAPTATELPTRIEARTAPRPPAQHQRPAPRLAVPAGSAERPEPLAVAQRQLLRMAVVEVAEPTPGATPGASSSPPAASEPPRAQPMTIASGAAEQPTAPAATVWPAASGQPEHRAPDPDGTAAARAAPPPRATSQPVAAEPVAPLAAAVVRSTAAAEATAVSASAADQPNTAATARPVAAAPPVVIGQITVQVANPEPAADPFAGCRALVDGVTAQRGGGW
jgi:hypothetical protein